jgi:hypothetical protein
VSAEFQHDGSSCDPPAGSSLAGVCHGLPQIAE